MALIKHDGPTTEGKPVQDLDVRNALDRRGGEITALSETISELSTRLSCVCREPVPEDKTDESKCLIGVCKIGKDLNTHAGSVCSMTLLVKDLIDRLEV